MFRPLLPIGVTLVFLSTSFASGAPGADDAPALAAFDVTWSLRAEGAVGGTARVGAVATVVAAGRSAVAARPGGRPPRGRGVG
jgi:hypothetical protein